MEEEGRLGMGGEMSAPEAAESGRDDAMELCQQRTAQLLHMHYYH